mgnify:CR=1 FL=1
MLKNNKTETPSFIIYLGDDQICRSIVKKNAEVKIEEAQKVTEIVQLFLSGEKLPILVDIRNIKSITKEAREHFTMKNREPSVSAIGLLVKSPLSMLVANFFIGINRSAVPTKLCINENKAKEWLLKFV